MYLQISQVNSSEHNDSQTGRKPTQLKYADNLRHTHAHTDIRRPYSHLFKPFNKHDYRNTHTHNIIDSTDKMLFISKKGTLTDMSAWLKTTNTVFIKHTDNYCTKS